MRAFFVPKNLLDNLLVEGSRKKKCIGALQWSPHPTVSENDVISWSAASSSKSPTSLYVATVLLNLRRNVLRLFARNDAAGN